MGLSLLINVVNNPSFNTSVLLSRKGGPMFETPLPKIDDKLKLSTGLQTVVGKQLLDTGIAGYEPEAMAACCAIVEELKISEFADIGANIGIFSLVLGKLFPDLKVLAFEPMPWIYEIAKSLFVENGISAEIRKEALSIEAGTAVFYASARADTSNSLNPNFRKHKDSFEVPVLSLDTLSKREAFFPKLIKIDTESTEPDVLAGGEELVAKLRPWIICEVLPGRTEIKLNEFIKKFGYTAYSLNASRFNEQTEVVGDDTSQFRDFLFAPEAVSQNLIECYEKWNRLFGELNNFQR